MLSIEIVDDDCADGEAHIFKVPVDTDWAEIAAAVRLFFPTATTVSILVKDTIEG